MQFILTDAKVTGHFCCCFVIFFFVVVVPSDEILKSDAFLSLILVNNFRQELTIPEETGSEFKVIV